MVVPGCGGTYLGAVGPGFDLTLLNIFYLKDDAVLASIKEDPTTLNEYDYHTISRMRSFSDVSIFHPSSEDLPIFI